MNSCGSDNPSSPDHGENNPDLISQDIGSNGGSLTSKDQRLTLIIPAGALGNTETITIEEVSASELGSEFDQVVSELEIDKAYNLGPDGLLFNDPITVSFQSDQTPIQDSDSAGVFSEFLFTSSNGRVEALDNLLTEPDFENGTVTVHGELSHFSPLATSKANNGVSFFVFNVPESLPVGGMFTARAEIHESMAGPLGDLVTVLGPAMYKDNSGSPIVPDFSPTTVEMGGNPDDGFTEMFPYICTAPGIGVYRTELNVRVRFDLNSGPVFATSFAPFITTIECIEPPTVVLNVEKEGEGVVTSEDGQINCGENCTAEYDQGSETTLSATPADGWIFEGWSGDVPNECDENTGDCTIVMDKETTVIATFVEEQPAIQFGDLKTCVEHGSSQSDIFWLWAISTDLLLSDFIKINITMNIILPNGNKVEVTGSPTEVSVLLMHLRIFTFGLYAWEIVDVSLEGAGVLFDGNTMGEVNVGAAEQNPGECAQ